MDFLSLKRKQLQSLCKKHGIPANKTNLEMADLLTAALKVKGNSTLEEDTIEIISSDDQKKSKKVRFSPDVETREYEPSGYKVPEPVRRTRRATKFASSSLEELIKSVLPDEVGNKRGRNGKMGRLTRTNRSQAKTGKEISSVTESDIKTDHLDGLNNSTEDIDQDGGEVRKIERGKMRNRSKSTDSDVINGVTNSNGGETRQGARRSARNGVKFTDAKLVLDEVINIDGGEDGKGAGRSARNGAKQTKPELTNNGVANVDGGEVIKGARRSARHGVKFTDREPLHDEVSNMDGVEAENGARRSARNGEEHTNPELVNDGVANVDGREVKKGARRSERNGAKSIDSELVNDGVVDGAGGESREGARRSVRNVAKRTNSEPFNDGKARKDARQSARSGANFRNSELVKDEVVNKAHSAATNSTFEGKEVFGATAKESKGIARATSKRKSVAQLGVAAESTLLVPNESKKRLKIVDFDEVTEVKASIETTDELKQAEPPVANPRKSRRKTIVLNSNIVADKSALDQATGKDEHKEKELRRSTRRAFIYGKAANSVKANEIAEDKEIALSVQEIQTTVVSESVVVKPSQASEQHAFKKKQKATTVLPVISEAAGGNDNSSGHIYGGLEHSKEKGISEGKLGGKRNTDHVDISALNSDIEVEIDSATNLAGATSLTLASDSKEETLKVVGETIVSNDIIVLDTGNLISDGCIKGGGEDEHCPSSAECVSSVNVKETLKVVEESDNAIEDIVPHTSSSSIKGDQCQSSEKCASLVNREETLEAEEEFEVVYENPSLETGNFIPEGNIEGDSDNQFRSHENFANLDNAEDISRGSAVQHENFVLHTGSSISGGCIECGSDDQRQSSKTYTNLENEEETLKVTVEPVVISMDNVSDTMNIDGEVQGDANDQHEPPTKCADLENEEETLKAAVEPVVISVDNVPDTWNSDGGLQCDADDQHEPSEKCATVENEEETLKVAVEPVVMSEDNVFDTGNLDGSVQGEAYDQHRSSENCTSPDNNSPADMGNSILDDGIHGAADDQYQSSENWENLDNNSPCPTELNLEEFQAKDLDVDDSSDGFSLANHSAFGGQNSNYRGSKKMVAEEKTSTIRDSNCGSDDINGRSDEFDGMNILERFEDEIENNLIPENERTLQSVNTEIVTESIRYLFQETDDVDDCVTEVGKSIEGGEVVIDLEWNKQDGTVHAEEHEQEIHQRKASLAVCSETTMEDAVDMCDGSNEHSNEIDRIHVEKGETGVLEKVGHGELTDEMEHVGEKEPRSTTEKSNVQELPDTIQHEAISSCSKFEVIMPAGIALKADSGCEISEVKFNHSFIQQKGKASCEGFNGEMEDDKVITSDPGNEEKSGEVTNNFTDDPSTGDDARSHDAAMEFNGRTVIMHEEDLIDNAGFVDELSFECKTKTQPMEAGREQCLHKLDDEIAIVADPKETAADTENLDSVTAFKDKMFDAIGDYESEAFELNLLFQAGENMVEKLNVEEMAEFVAVYQPQAFTASVANPDERRNSCELKLLSPKETRPFLENGRNDDHCESLSFSAMKIQSTTGLIQMTPMKEHEQAFNQMEESLDVGAETIMADTEVLCDGANEQSYLVERHHTEKDGVGGLEKIEHVDSTDEDQLEVEPSNCKDSFEEDCKTVHQFEKENIQDAKDKETVALVEYGCHDSELSGNDSKAELEIVKENSQLVQNSDQHDIAPRVALTCEETTRFEYYGEDEYVLEGTQVDALPEIFMDEAKDGTVSNNAMPKNSSDETCENNLGDNMSCAGEIGDCNVGGPFLPEASDAPKREDTHLEVQVESTLFADIEINMFHGNSEHDKFVPNDLSSNDLEQAMHVEEYHLDKCNLVLEDSSRCVELSQDKDTRIEGDGKQMQFDKATNAQEFIDFQDDKDNNAANSSFSAHGSFSVDSYTSNAGQNDSVDQSKAMDGLDILKEQTNINEVEEDENGGNVPKDFSDEALNEMERTILHEIISNSNKQEEISSSVDSDCGEAEMDLCHSFEQQNGKTSQDEFDGQTEDGKIIASNDGRMQKCDEHVNNPIDNPTAGNDTTDQCLGENKTVIQFMEAVRELILPELDNEAAYVANSKPFKGITTETDDSLSYEGENEVEKPGVGGSPTKLLENNTIGQLSSIEPDEEADDRRQENAATFIVQETKEEIQQLDEIPDFGATMVDQSHAFTTLDHQDEDPREETQQSHSLTALDNQGVAAEEDKVCDLKTDMSSHPETGNHRSVAMSKRRSSTSLILSTPQKVVDLLSKKENALHVKMELPNSLTASRMSYKRRPLEELKKQ